MKEKKLVDSVKVNKKPNDAGRAVLDTIQLPKQP